MFDPPSGTVLGDLRMVKTIEHDDFPRIFVCQNAAQQEYLVLSTYDDDERCTWLYLPMSERQLNSTLAGDVSLRQALLAPEGGFLYVVKTFVDSAPEVLAVDPAQIADDDLPAADFFLKQAPLKRAS